MAVKTARVLNVEIIRGDDDVIGADTATFKLKRAFVHLDNDSQAVTGGTDTLDCALATAIQNSVRNGKTVTVRSAAIAGCLSNAVGTFSGTSSLAASTISITPKTSDWSTNANITAVAAVRPYIVACFYSEA